MLLIAVLIIVTAISSTSLQAYAGGPSSTKQQNSQQNLRDLLNEQTKDQLVQESVMLYGYIDWQETEINKRDTMIVNRDAALKDCGQVDCGLPITEVVMGVLAGALLYSFIDR